MLWAILVILLVLWLLEPQIGWNVARFDSVHYVPLYSFTH
jgi:hypothetical protein